MSPDPLAPNGTYVIPQPPCILVVEDDLLIRLLLCDELRDAGFRVIETCNADEALIMLETLEPEMIISDVKMPGSVDGLGLLAIVKHSMPDVPVVIISGHCDARLADSAALFLRKPFSIVHLVSSIQELLVSRSV